MDSSDSASDIEEEYFQSSDESSCYEVEDAELESCQQTDPTSDVENQECLYGEEPLADEEWLQEYNRERQEKEQQLIELQNRLNGDKVSADWCTCGNCEVGRLQNPKQCQCCREIDDCMTSLQNELVLREIETLPDCVTSHPGFDAVCLNQWSLRSSAAKYRTIDGMRYRQTGTENEFLRATAYREFTQLIHGHLGTGRRYPIPACAYNAIRKKFPGEDYTGYEDDE